MHGLNSIPQLGIVTFAKTSGRVSFVRFTQTVYAYQDDNGIWVRNAETDAPFYGFLCSAADVVSFEKVGQ